MKQGRNRVALATHGLGMVLVAALVSVAHADDQVIEKVGFATPESVEYYADQDVYLVSEVNGGPLDRDGNGFISKLSPSGEMLDLKWIDSGKGDAVLDAPKGLAISGQRLFVADLAAVHVFELPGGRQLRSIPIEGASVLNGISPVPDGSVIVSDTGYKKGGDDIAPSGTDAIYQVWPDGRVKTIARDENMGHPNGVYYVSDDDILVVTFGSGALFRISLDGKRKDLKKPPHGTLDGVQQLPDGRILVSSWQGDAIYVLGKDGAYSTLVGSVKDPADLGFDSKRDRLLMPLTNSDEVAIHDLSH